MYGISYADTARLAFRALPPDQRRELIRIINTHIWRDPEPDGLLKHVAWWLGAMYRLYRDPQQRWVLYVVQGSDIIISGVGVGRPALP
ncbi:MAG TPA: hypothetical protein VLA19_30280 [Herpetosiphonaceae bacterium]|nr:hypothetical protein [Herpetosiphonaceae bacterium]